jgi:hypothetical protein
MLVPSRCLPLLREQRTKHNDLAKDYGVELRRTYESIKPYLPKRANRIMDIGCGMAGIDVLLSEHYGHEVEIVLVDKQGVSPTINSGFAQSGDWFSYYHDFDAALELLEVNGVPLENVRCVDLLEEPFPEEDCDIAISLLSWGFHFPISDYFPAVREGGVIIADVRKDTNGMDLLKARGSVAIAHTAELYHRAVCAPLGALA